MAGRAAAIGCVWMRPGSRRGWRRTRAPVPSNCYVGSVGSTVLPYDILDLEHSVGEARRFARMESIYHRGQDLAWDGQTVLADLFAKHGEPCVATRHREPLRRVLGTIMWGELAAFKVAAQLADDLEPLEARMAAISQAHDEARHFYVLRDYLERTLGGAPRAMSRRAERLVAAALHADTSPKKLLGMQLQLEPTALCIFHALREASLCPILSELLVLFEKDEARHVGLGVQLLPTMLRTMRPLEAVAFTGYSFRVAILSIATLKELESDLTALGVSPRRVATLGKSKQMLAFEELWREAPKSRSDAVQHLSHALESVAEVLWPEPGASLPTIAGRVLRTLRTGFPTVPTTLDPTTSD